MRFRIFVSLAMAGCLAGGCGSPICVDAGRASAVPDGSTVAAVARKVGGRGTVLFRDDRGEHPIEAIAYRIGRHQDAYVFLYTDGRLTKVSAWDGGGTTTDVPGVGPQMLSGSFGALRPDALLDAELGLANAASATVARDALSARPIHPNAEDDAFFYGFVPLIVFAAPVWVPMTIAQKLAARTAADVPLGKPIPTVDRALGRPDRVWPEAAGSPGEWRRYQRPDGDDPYANIGPIHVLFRCGRAVAAFGPALADGLGY